MARSRSSRCRRYRSACRCWPLPTRARSCRAPNKPPALRATPDRSRWPLRRGEPPLRRPRRRGSASVARATRSWLVSRSGPWVRNLFGVTIGQRTLQLLARVKQPAHDCTLRDTHRLSHFLVAQALDFAHHDDTPMVDRERVQRGFELVSDLATPNNVERIRAVDATE